MRRTLLITLAILAAAPFAGSAAPDVIEKAAYEAGRQDAAKDVRENRLIVEVFGLPAPWSGEYMKVLAEKYHIETKTVAGCIVDAKIIGHAKGYNEVSMAQIERRFGKGFLDSVAEDVRQRWEREHKQ